MLLNLCIRNYALIDELSIDFTSGLNVLTGETGAGKSIIIDAINLIIGERASTDFIRTGKQNASVEALFSYNNLLVDDILREYGVEPEDNKTLIISRELSLQGRSICRANGKMVTVSALKRIGNLLIDIHGQHQHQSLLDSKNHIRLLDLYGYDEISVLKKNVSSLYNKYRNLCKELESLKTKHKDFEKQQDRLRFEVNEIEQAQLKPDEETQLEEEKKILENAEKISNVLEEAYNLLYEGYQTPSIIDNLNKTVDAFEDIKDYYQILTVVLESLTNMLYELEDISTTIRKLKDSIDFDAGKLNVINSRLEMINRIKSKYNKSIPELLTYKEEAAAQLDKALDLDEKINDLNCQLANIKTELIKNAVELSDKRKKVAADLEESISKELKDLNMKNVKFKADITVENDDFGIEINNKKTNITEDGIDKIEFLISTNPGEPLKPLTKIISGGESSRIMLALKSIIARVDNISCLIFDEIDSGIGGRTAQVVGEKLYNISRKHQVLCVTHSPQIASLGDTHFLITKHTESGETFTRVYNIDSENRVSELARMLGGAEITKNTIVHAKEMLRMAKKVK